MTGSIKEISCFSAYVSARWGIHFIEVYRHELNNELIFVHSRYSASFSLSFSWPDDQVSYRDLNTDTDLNAIPRDFVDQIWHPVIVMQNARGTQNKKGFFFIEA